MFWKEWGEDCSCSRAEYNLEHTHIESSPDAASWQPLSAMEWDVNMMQEVLPPQSTDALPQRGCPQMRNHSLLLKSREEDSTTGLAGMEAEEWGEKSLC